MGVLQVQQSWTAHLLLNHILSGGTSCEPNEYIEVVRHNLRGGRKESGAEQRAANVLPHLRQLEDARRKDAHQELHARRQDAV